MMNLHEMQLNQLDAQLKYWQESNQQAPRPRIGWVRTIRKALGMTIIQLAKRLDLNPSRIVKIESAEIHGNVTLKTLQETAEALECTFIYALVPKNSLKSLLLEKASNAIKRRVERVSHSMALEDQAVSKKYQDEEIEALQRTILSRPRMISSLWNEPNMISSYKRRTKTGRKKPRGRKK